MPLPPDAVKWAVDAFRDGRNERYETYARYIAGEQPLAFATEKFRSAFGRLFDAFAYNRCLMVRDAHADRLRVEGFGADADTLAQAAQALWDANAMDLREGHLEADAFGLGDAYLLVEMHPARGTVQYWVQDPRTMRVHYADDVPGEIDLAAKLWRDADTERTRLNLYFRDRIEKYITRTRTHQEGPPHPGAFERHELDGEPWPMPLNLTDTVPVFHVANNGRTNAYGHSEIQPVLPLQDAVNKTLMDLFVASEFGAFPQRVFIGLETPTTDEDKAKFAQIELGITRAVSLEDPAARIAEFSATDLAQYLAVLEFLDKAISRATKVPTHYLGMSGDFTSGVSKRIAEAPFTAKLEDRTKAFGQVIAAAQGYGLRLQGLAVPDGALRVNWAPVAPLTDEDELDMALTKQTLGYPLPTLLREMGYEPDQVAAIMAEKRAAAYEAQRAFDAGVSADNEEAAD